MAEPTDSLAAQLETAAAVLTADPLLAAANDLLRQLGYADGDAAAAADRARMLRAGAAMRRLFRLAAPDAPGLVFFGGEADPAVLGLDPGLPVGSLAGSGLDAGRAFEACVGEGVEYLCQFAQPSDPIRRARLDGNADAVDFVRAACGGAETLDWVAAQHLTDGSDAWFPADLCLRRPAARRDFTPPLKLSTGCAAGPTRDAATLRALLELIERDAAALWWRGGRRGRPIRPDSPAGHAAALLLAQLRHGRSDRRTWLLDITTDLGVPAVAALSADADGFGFAFGLSARLTLAEAVRSAIFELCQVELGRHVIAAKRAESGDAALNDSDRKQLHRTTALDTRACLLLQPDGEPAGADPAIPADPAGAVGWIAGALAGKGIDARRLDLTRERFAIPVVRVLAPGLQLDPCEIVSERLAAAMSATGGGARHTGGMALL
jgi:ribosomal protein S12 methylthiotransferase accessory factor